MPNSGSADKLISVIPAHGTFGLGKDSTDRKFWADVLARIRRRTRSDQDAEDLLHSAWLRLFAYRMGHDVQEPTGFILRTAANLAVDQHRQRKRLVNQPVEEFHASLEDGSPLQDEVLAARERLRRVQAGLERLPARTRQIFVMHKVERMKLREIAQALGITQSAVEKHLAKAVLFLTEWTQGW
ncbi:MAG TPA: RNA polymerase sigma factor [Rhizomicrobium sp.]|nr:RNA polymerase sigma factor [Rhizomicrobium sp.]